MIAEQCVIGISEKGTPVPGVSPMRHAVPAFLFSILLFSGTVTGATPLQETIKAVEAQAYRDFTNGDIHEGAVRLIELARALPDNDASVINDLIGPAQLLGFAVSSLMHDWPGIHRLENEVLQPDIYPTDKLLIAAKNRLSGSQRDALMSQWEFLQLSRSEHQWVRTIALFSYSEPFFYGKNLIQNYAVISSLLLSHSELELSRHLVELPVYARLNKAVKLGKKRTNLLENVLYAGGRKDMALHASPGLAIVAEALPSLNLRDVNNKVIQHWATALCQESDPKSRYTLLFFLDRTSTTKQRRVLTRKGLEAIVNQPPETPDIDYARMMLADFAQTDNDPDSLLMHVNALLKLEVLPCTIDKFMYEEVMRTIQRASRFFSHNELYDVAIQLHEGLGRKFPNSALAEKELRQVKSIRRDFLGVSLNDIRSDDPLEAYWEGMIGNTIPSPLRESVIEQLMRLNLEMDEEIETSNR